MTNHRLFRATALTALLLTFLLMVVGNAVRVMDASQGCPDWPTCYGGWALTTQAVAAAPNVTALYLQYAHRALALASGLFTLIAAAWAVRSYRQLRWVTLPLVLALVSLTVEAALGGEQAILGNSGGFAPWLAALHMALALLTLALVTAATLAVYTIDFAAARRLAVRLNTPFNRLSAATLLAVFTVLISGTLVTATGAQTACAGFPLCQNGGLPTQALGWLALAHRIIVAAVAVLMIAQFARAWRSQRSQPVTLAAATAAAVLLIGQSVIGAVRVQRGFAAAPADLIGLHAASAAALFAVQVIVFLSAGFAGRTAADEAAESAQPLVFRARARDFLQLNKPIIVLLLLATTYAGMVVGGKSIPALPLVAWTMIGGFLAAGGASALNQYIDIEIDRAMQRTAKRPLPDGRLMPAEALAYGIAACLTAFFLLTITVNFLAAVLSFVGMVYYVLIYSVWLKHITVQNIVIGGGAGAIPPLVGWAAATGALNIPSLFLFVIIFLWTPPHFWALALVRKNDYARGKVPMLPVIRGEKETRRQIWIYTLELVGFTLLLPVFHLAGWVYLISALLLGAWLTLAAWRVFRTEGSNKVAFRMYRYSSMYLAFLMLAMVLDVLIH